MEYDKLIDVYIKETGRIPSLEALKSCLEKNLNESIHAVTAKEQTHAKKQEILDQFAANTEADLGKDVVPLIVTKNYMPETIIADYLVKTVIEYAQTQKSKEQRKLPLKEELNTFSNLIENDLLNEQRKELYFKEQTNCNLNDKKTRSKLERLQQEQFEKTARTTCKLKEYSQEIKDFNNWLETQFEENYGTLMPIDEEVIASKLKGTRNRTLEINGYSTLLENETNHQLFQFYLATQEIKKQEQTKNKNKKLFHKIKKTALAGLACIGILGGLDLASDKLSCIKFDSSMNSHWHHEVKGTEYVLGPNVIE